MRDKTHIEHVERWAHYVKEHPTEWKKNHTLFINAVYEKADHALERLAQQPGGAEKIAKLIDLRRKKT